MESFTRRSDPMSGGGRLSLSRRELLAATALGVAAPRVAFAAAPDGELTYAIHVSLAPSWFDPADTLGIITPFMVLYALHDAMVKPMPGKAQAPSLAESWKASEDGLSYEFAIRNNAKFHNGEPVTAEATRLAALKRGEVDIAYSIRSELAEELERTPGLTLKPVVLQAPNWLYFPEQWDPKSPWHDLRVRQAANLAIDRDGMSKALFLGYCKITNSIVPYTFDYHWQPPAPVYDPDKAKKLMAAAGHA